MDYVIDNDLRCKSYSISAETAYDIAKKSFLFNKLHIDSYEKRTGKKVSPLVKAHLSERMALNQFLEPLVLHFLFETFDQHTNR